MRCLRPTSPRPSSFSIFYDPQHVVYQSLDVAEVEFLRREGLVHVLFVRRPAQRRDPVHLGDLEEHLGVRASFRASDCPHGWMAQEVRRAGQRPERPV